MSTKIALVTPVLDDWGSLSVLLSDISDLFTGSGIAFEVYAVDDGSSTQFDPGAIILPTDSCIASIEVIRLAVNLGHQRAIAVGLCAVAERAAADAVLVMDSDGEDRPADIARLLAAGAEHPQHVVLAARARRTEPGAFRLWYRLYRLIFRGLTGRTINFGNYCLIPMGAVRRLVHMPELWNHLAASVMRSRLGYTTVPTARGRRLSGRSKMNFAALLLHGFGAMSVYSDVIFARMLVAAAFVAATACTGIAAVAVIRLATDLAIPGWATTAAGDLLIVLAQTVAVAIVAILSLLARRSSRPIVPLADCAAFVAGRERCRPDRDRSLLLFARPGA